eukprot:2071876-Pleurochrysis_carterae.AAC.1
MQRACTARRKQGRACAAACANAVAHAHTSIMRFMIDTASVRMIYAVRASVAACANAVAHAHTSIM